MSRFDYGELQGVARDLITEFGAPATAIIPGEGFEDPLGRDWRGEDAAGTVSVPIEIAIVDFNDDEIDGDQVRRTDQKGLTFPPSTGEDLRNARQVLRGTDRFSIERVTVYQPATALIAYEFQLRR